MNRLCIPLVILLLPLPAQAEPSTVIHILNWHYVSRDDFAADLRTEPGKPLTDDQIDRLIEAQHQLNLLEAGAAIRLVMSDELKTLLPTEDSKAMEAANPVRADGSVVFDKKADEAREDAIVKNLLKSDGVVVVVLGGGHDLTDNIKRAGGSCKYERVVLPSYGKQSFID